MLEGHPAFLPDQEDHVSQPNYALIPSLCSRDSDRDSQMGLTMIQCGDQQGCAMPIPLRADFDAAELRRQARWSNDAAQTRRLLTLASIYDGASRTAASLTGGVTLQIIRDWVVKFNTRGPGGLIDRKPPGQPSRLDDIHRAALRAIIESGPIPAIHGVVRWRLIDLCQWLWDEFQISVAKPTLSRELRMMGYRKLSARPRHHAQREGSIELFKRVSPPCWTRSRASRASTLPM